MTLRNFFSLFVSGLLITVVIALWFPEYSKYYIKDNRVVENIGAQLFLWSGLISLYATWVWQKKKYIPFMIALIGLVCALDEISWGRGELQFEPYKVMGVKIDAVHDFMDVFRNVVETYGGGLMFWVLAAALLAILFLATYQFRRFFADFFIPPRGVLFITVTVLFLVSSLGDLLDLELSKNGKIYFSMLEEYLETAGALALLFIGWSLVREGRAKRQLGEVMQE